MVTFEGAGSFQGPNLSKTKSLPVGTAAMPDSFTVHITKKNVFEAIEEAAFVPMIIHKPLKAGIPRVLRKKEHKDEAEQGQNHPD